MNVNFQIEFLERNVDINYCLKKNSKMTVPFELSPTKHFQRH